MHILREGTSLNFVLTNSMKNEESGNMVKFWVSSRTLWSNKFCDSAFSLCLTLTTEGLVQLYEAICFNDFLLSYVTKMSWGVFIFLLILASFTGTQLLSTVLGVKDFLRSEFLKVEEDILIPYKRIFPSPVTFEDFVWAFGILRSRTFSGLSGENLILTPVADLVSYL